VSCLPRPPDAKIVPRAPRAPDVQIVRKLRMLLVVRRIVPRAQRVPDVPRIATRALFVSDVFLVIAGRAPRARDVPEVPELEDRQLDRVRHAPRVPGPRLPRHLPGPL